jgi:hypothetical protein
VARFYSINSACSRCEANFIIHIKMLRVVRDRKKWPAPARRLEIDASVDLVRAVREQASRPQA